MGEAFSIDTKTVVRTKARSVGNKIFLINNLLFFKPFTLFGYYGAIFMFLKIAINAVSQELDSANSSIFFYVFGV